MGGQGVLVASENGHSRLGVNRLLIGAWTAWLVTSLVLVGYAAIAVTPITGNYLYCVSAADGSPDGSEVSLSLVPFGARCTSYDGRVTGPYLVWSVWLVVLVLSGLALVIGTTWRRRRNVAFETAHASE